MKKIVIGLVVIALGVAAYFGNAKYQSDKFVESRACKYFCVTAAFS
jgi:hypothetical protein